MNSTAFTFDNNVISDLHKDVYGFRPSEFFWEFWLSATDDEKQTKWDTLCDRLAAKEEQDQFEQQLAVERFERLVATHIAAGAADRATALRWIMDCSGADGDWEFLAWESGLPLRYFDKTA